MIKFFTEIEIAGIIIRDPVTAITNVLIVLTAFWCFLQFRNRELGEAQRTWRWFFLFLSISALVAVVVHGFSYYTSEETHLFIWTSMCLIQGLGITFAQLATVMQYFPERTRRLWLLVPGIQFVVFCVILLGFHSYEVTKIHIAAGLVPIMVWNAILHFSAERTGGPIALGIFVATITAFVHTFKISFGNWFNHNDISHILLCFALWLICKGVLRTATQTETVNA